MPTVQTALNLYPDKMWVLRPLPPEENEAGSDEHDVRQGRQVRDRYYFFDQKSAEAAREEHGRLEWWVGEVSTPKYLSEGLPYNGQTTYGAKRNYWVVARIPYGPYPKNSDGSDGPRFSRWEVHDGSPRKSAMLHIVGPFTCRGIALDVVQLLQNFEVRGEKPYERMYDTGVSVAQLEKERYSAEAAESLAMLRQIHDRDIKAHARRTRDRLAATEHGAGRRVHLRAA